MGGVPADDGGKSTTTASGTTPSDGDLDLVGFSLIVDDIVYWDGRTSMANVGGGGPQTLWGYAVAAEALQTSGAAATARPPPRVALAAGVGESDLPASVRDWLSGPALGADLSGLFPCPGLPTPRAWQLLEEDGRRTQVWRCAATDALYRQLRPPFASLPERLRRARSYHIGLHAAHPPRSLLASLRRAVDERRGAAAEGDGGGGGDRDRDRGFLSAETYTRCDAPLTAGELRALLEPLDVFSPNEDEAASMLGVVLPRAEGEEEDDGDDDERAAASAREAERLLLDPLLDAAPGLTVTLRRGRRGAIAKSSCPDGGGGGSGGVGRASAFVRVPAVRGLAAVDPTGCGNAFCGAFLAATHAGAGLREAVAWGCAAGGTMAEHEGVPGRGGGAAAAAASLGSLAPVVARRARDLLRLRVEARAFGSVSAMGGRREAAASSLGRRLTWGVGRTRRWGRAERARASASASASARWRAASPAKFF